MSSVKVQYECNLDLWNFSTYQRIGALYFVFIDLNFILFSKLIYFFRYMSDYNNYALQLIRLSSTLSFRKEAGPLR